MTDVLTLGGFQFTGYSVPDVMMGGGNQAMVVHKLPGGSRVIDTLGPDEAQISWSGHFFDQNAYTWALQVDAMRAAGQLVSLTWGGQSRQVIIESFIYRVHRLPAWVDYAVVCTVYLNPQLGNLGTVGSLTSLVNGDLASAVGLLG